MPIMISVLYFLLRQRGFWMGFVVGGALSTVHCCRVFRGGGRGEESGGCWRWPDETEGREGVVGYGVDERGGWEFHGE